jgi:diguanylate cyclase (GGDEF)-like protein
MTLYRQLLLFTLCLLITLFIGSWLSNLQSTRIFLQDQLESHAQDTATSLGLSISTHLADTDTAAMDTMVNAIFDRGYYKTIQLNDLTGLALVKRSVDVQLDGIPNWFIKWVPLTAPSATAMIMNGWQQTGTIIVHSHPGYAYKTLWESAAKTALGFSLTAVLVSLLGGYFLRILLRPLQRVEHQALALCKQEYEIQEDIPKTRELRQVVTAMNQMTKKIKSMFAEQAQVAQRLREHAYLDDLTGLGNRRFLESQVTARLRRGTENNIQGMFLLLQVHNLQQLNDENGFEAGDTLLKRISQLLLETINHVNNFAAARLTGGDFGIFLPDINQEEAERTCEAISNQLNKLVGEQLSLTSSVGNMGGVIYTGTTSFKQLLSVADNALRNAAGQGQNTWSLQPLNEKTRSTAHGRQKWKEVLVNALKNKEFVLYTQPCMICKKLKKRNHLEILARIIHPFSGEILSAGLFLPTAESLGLTTELDKLVIELALDALADQTTTEILAINISTSSILDEEFSDWLFNRLAALPKDYPPLQFEFTEFTAVNHLESIRTIATRLKALGHGFALDHFGQSFSNFGYLKSLRPDYVKIDRAYTDDLTNADSDAHFFISSLCVVAHSLDITVIAEGVETEQQLHLLQKLQIDGVQGFFIGRPEPLRANA